MNESCEFSAELAYEHTKLLCYPRRIGSAGEQQARQYIQDELEALGLQPRHETFQVSHFPKEIAGRLVLAAVACLVAAGLWQVSNRPLVAALCWAAAAYLVNSPWRAGGPRARTLPPRTTTANVLASLPHDDAAARIVFMAHYDTKSQLLPTGVRVGLVYTAAVSCVLLAVLGLLQVVGLPIPASSGPWFLAGLALVAVSGLLLNLTGNRSPGALDNGSAVGTLLELARTWRPEPGAPAEVHWVATGAEEVGLDGARHFLGARESWWYEKPTLLINLESVGSGSAVYLAGLDGSVRLAEGVASELGYAHARFRVLGAGMDHEPFAARGLASLSILGDVVGRSMDLHSTRDNMARIDSEALERAGRLATHLAWRWAQMHQPVIDARLAGAEAMTSGAHQRPG